MVIVTHFLIIIFASTGFSVYHLHIFCRSGAQNASQCERAWFSIALQSDSGSHAKLNGTSLIFNYDAQRIFLSSFVFSTGVTACDKDLWDKICYLNSSFSLLRKFLFTTIPMRKCQTFHCLFM